MPSVADTTSPALCGEAGAPTPALTETPGTKTQCDERLKTQRAYSWRPWIEFSSFMPGPGARLDSNGRAAPSRSIHDPVRSAAELQPHLDRAADTDMVTERQGCLQQQETLEQEASSTLL